MNIITTAPNDNDLIFWLEMDNQTLNIIRMAERITFVHEDSSPVYGGIIIGDDEDKAVIRVPSYLDTKHGAIRAKKEFILQDDCISLWNVFSWAIEPGDMIRLVWEDNSIDFPNRSYRDTISHETLAIEVRKKTMDNRVLNLPVASYIGSKQYNQLLRYPDTSDATSDVNGKLVT